MKFNTAITAHLLMSKRFLMWVLLVVILLGCSKQSNGNVSDLEKNFSTLIPISDVNESLQLVVDGEKTHFEAGEKIRLKLSNQSARVFSFDLDAHIKILTSPDQLEWVEVKNAMTYSGELRLAPKGTILFDTRTTHVKPILERSSLNSEQESISLRIVLVGEIMEKEKLTGEKVAAYVDVLLKP
jgi:hypothetical protein